jgi:hypothetical protein
VLGKHELDGGTSLHLELEPGGVGHLALPQSTESNEQVVYDYRVGEEQGQLRFTFEHNPCPSEEGCALPRTGPQSNAGGLGWLALCSLLAVRKLRVNARESQRR